MIKYQFHKRVTITSTVLFLIGWYSSTDSDLMELWVIVFGYLPTVGILFSWSVANLTDRWTPLFISTSIFYCILHFLFLNSFVVFNFYNFNVKEILLPAIGASATLAILLYFTKKLHLHWSDFAITFFIGGLSFLPWAIANSILALIASIYFWQLIIGNYFNYLITKFKVADII